MFNNKPKTSNKNSSHHPISSARANQVKHSRDCPAAKTKVSDKWVKCKCK